MRRERGVRVGEAIYTRVCGVRVRAMPSRLVGVLYLAGSVLFLVDGAQNNDALGLGGGVLFTLGSLLLLCARRE